MGGGPRQPQIPTTPDSTNTEGGLSKGGYSSHYNEVD